MRPHKAPRLLGSGVESLTCDKAGRLSRGGGAPAVWCADWDVRSVPSAHRECAVTTTSVDHAFLRKCRPLTTAHCAERGLPCHEVSAIRSYIEVLAPLRQVTERPGRRFQVVRVG
ncbi:hypothetical protein ABZ208_04145 [Streptomyces sp. NPDC006208]|uniref:hypothetical protein n=1 Tax=Streptomyces sp. NPDC006208 TaxID=3156734 RepID=UPI0033AAC355